MVVKKYSPVESINKMKLMMNYDSSKTLSENSNSIQLINTTDNYLFDFVVAESSGFVIYMDNVISKEHGYIGNIWENTWVFNQIIRENINKYSSLIGESVERDLDSILMSINWTKEFVAECILNVGTLSEGFSINEQFLDKLKAGAQKIAQGIDRTNNAIAQGARKVLSKAAEYGKKLLSGPILGTLRWIRRTAYTDLGTVVDVVTAILPATTGINRFVWFLIVILDIWEIINSNYDNEDQDRLADPYRYLITDLVAFLFSFVGGQAVKTALTSSAKLPSNVVKLLTNLLDKLPGLKNTLKSIGDFLIKYIPGLKQVVDFVLWGLNKVVSGVENFIKQLFSKSGVQAVGVGLAIMWFFKERTIKLGDVGEDVGAINKFISERAELYYSCPIDEDIKQKTAIAGNTFTKETQIGVKSIEACISKQPDYKLMVKKIDGEVTNHELGLYANIAMNDRGIVSKIIPHETKEGALKVLDGIVSHLAKGAEYGLSKVTKK